MSVVNDEWRLQIDVHQIHRVDALAARLRARDLRHDLSEEFHDTVIVTCDGTRVFLYAGTREQAELAQKVLEADAHEHSWAIDIEFRRWHPISEEWEDPDVPLPETNVAKTAERRALMAREREESTLVGYPEYEVRVDAPSRRSAVMLSEQLRNEGLPAVRRWQYLVVGANDEDTADKLANRIRNEAPAGSRVAVEGTRIAASAGYGRNPFVIFGGLGD